jgi:osmotically-inducible protein OsmY
MRTRLLATLLALSATASLSGCATALFTGAGAGVLMADDRRTSGTYVTDESIELKTSYRFSEQAPASAHVSFTSYNRRLLITGQAPTEAVKNSATEIARQHPDVREVINEVTIGDAASLSTRTNDGYLTAKVKTRLLDDKRISANHVKVVTENGVVYLMGLVKREESQAAAEIAARTGGVNRVVKIFEYTD